MAAAPSSVAPSVAERRCAEPVEHGLGCEEVPWRDAAGTVRMRFRATCLCGWVGVQLWYTGAGALAQAVRLHGNVPRSGVGAQLGFPL